MIVLEFDTNEKKVLIITQLPALKFFSFSVSVVTVYVMFLCMASMCPCGFPLNSLQFPPTSQKYGSRCIYYAKVPLCVNECASVLGAL